MNSQFNAIDYAQQLAAAGVPRAQADMHAKALMQALSACVATKADLAALDQKLSARMDLLEARMDTFEARVMARIEAFEAKVERELAEMRVELAEMRVELAEMRGELAEMRGEISVMRAERKYDRRLINLVLAMQVALIVKAFFP